MEPTEQASSTPRPKRRRHRWLIAAVLLFVVSTVTWWYWPRGDARFVGKWVLSYTQYKIPCELRSNGIGSVQNSPGDVSWFPWSVTGNKLTFGREARVGIAARGLLSARNFLAKLTGHHIYLDLTQAYEIKNIRPTEIELYWTRAQEAALLRRIPD